MPACQLPGGRRVAPSTPRVGGPLDLVRLAAEQVKMAKQAGKEIALGGDSGHNVRASVRDCRLAGGPACAASSAPFFFLAVCP